MSETKVLSSVKEMGACIERIIKEADEYLYIISPYVKIDKQIRRLLTDKHNSNGLSINFIFGKKGLEPEINDWLRSMSHIQTGFVKDLHAKCYLNEKEALVTSLNLYDYSMIHNIEMGVFVSTKGWLPNEKDKSLHRSIVYEAKWITGQAEAPPASASSAPAVRSSRRASAKSEPSKTPKREVAVIESGFCIRCGTGIVPDPAKPYCVPHYRSWNRFKNNEYEEEHCHLCGKGHSATMLKPVCYSCYKKYKDVFEFPAA